MTEQPVKHSSILSEKLFTVLIALCKPDQVEILIKLLEEVSQDTGFGGVEIVIANNRIQTFKVVKSYK